METDISCQTVRELVPAWFLGDETEHDAAIRAHVRGCCACREAVQALHPLYCAVPRSWMYEALRGTAPAGLAEDIRRHLTRCPACRDEECHLRETDRLCHRHLAPCRLSRGFAREVAGRWAPVFGLPSRSVGTPGLGAQIERAAAGNVYARERLAREFGPYVYLRLFLLTGDFQWADASARVVFEGGIPLACMSLSRRGLLEWFDARCAKAAQRHPWYDDFVPDIPVGMGLSSGNGSRTLLRHRQLVELLCAADARDAVAFLADYVEGMRLEQIAAWLDWPADEIIARRGALFRRIAAVLVMEETAAVGASCAAEGCGVGV